MKLDLSKSNSEVLHLNDPILIQELTNILIKPSMSEEDLLSNGWYVYCHGDT